MLKVGWQRERTLFQTGLFCFALGLAETAVLVIRGRFIDPDGDLAKPLAFNLALGTYVLTIALLAHLARFSAPVHRCWRTLQIVLALGSVVIANIQTYRGIDPRFPHSAEAIDHLASLLFGLLAAGGTVTFACFIVQLFRRRAPEAESLLVLSTRYASVAAMIGYATGLWMILNGGSRYGASGDILPLHALGFHALQAVPVIALLLGWGCVPLSVSHRLVHVAGTAWLSACMALLWQTLLGRAVRELSPATLVALVSLFSWLLVMVRAAAAWLRCLGLPAYYRTSDQAPGFIASERQPRDAAHRPAR
jgi:hypothetical protein